MDNLYLHPTTKLLLQSMVNNLPQSLLLSGGRGVGLFTIAHALVDSSNLLILRPEYTNKNAGSISVEAIRNLYQQTRTKSKRQRIVIIDDADTMSPGGQAAFLKLLEEPNPSTYFILTSHAPDKLLPTVRSRVQQLQIQPISSMQSTELIEKQGVKEPTKRSQLLFLASGLPAELTRLAHDSAYFQTRAVLVSDARSFLTATVYQKLQIIQRYRTDRDEALRFIDSTTAILHHSLQAKPQEKLVQQLAKLLEARERIASNQSIALQLSMTVL